MVARRIHVELVVGIAEQFGLSAHEVGIILAHEGIRRSAVDPSTFEIGIEADVFGFGHDGAMHRKRREKAWFPSSELAFLHVNFAFRTSGEVETMPSGQRKDLRGFRPVRQFSVPETSHFQVTTAATATELGAEATRTTHLRVQFNDNNNKPAYAVAGAELARFYLASLGLVAQQLLSVDYDFNGAVAKLVDPERTGRIDDRRSRSRRCRRCATRAPPCSSR